MTGVSAVSQNGLDVTDQIAVLGSVNYGKAGNYTLTYKVTLGADVSTATRVVSVGDGTFTQPALIRTDGSDRTIAVDSGSYRTGDAPTGGSSNGNEFHRPQKATNIDNVVANRGPLPTNKWWSGFLHSNYGGVTVAATNPLSAGFNSNGLYVSYKGAGFTQYFSVPDTYGVNQTTMSNFANVAQDITLRSSSLSSAYVTSVSDYDDDSVTISSRNSANGLDEMVTHLVQGSPFITTEFRDPSNVSLNLRIPGVTKPYEFLDVSGSAIAGSYTGDSVVVHLPGVHTGYVTTYPNPGVNAPVYSDLYYLVSAPTGTAFTMRQDQHSNPNFFDKISLSMSQGNYVSVAAIPNPSEAKYYHDAAAALSLKNTISYSVNEKDATTATTFNANVQYLNGIQGTNLMSLLPAQWKNSDNAVTNHTIPTIRGTTKILEGTSFTTHSSFYGVLPSFTLPDTPTFSKANMTTYLDELIAGTVPGTVSLAWQDGGKDFVNAPGPYWNAKALYPLSQGLIIADQLGLTAEKTTILSRLKMLMTDWYTYSGTDDVRYFYYDNIWGSMIYSTDNFSTGSRLSDHHFTSGYLVFASAVLAMYDADFLSQYGQMAKLVLKDYMNYDGDAMYPAFRGFDPYNGHSWADGFGDFGDGNDQESCGESLNSWTAGYLLGVALGDEAITSAAAWGFSTEMEGIKQYWFNYDENNWISSLADYTHVLGIVWGCKNDYATWFGSNPEFIYGIHWLPTGEYLTSYALGSNEKAMLKKIYSQFLSRVNGAPRTWQSNMWSIQSIFDPTAAISNFNADAITSGDYPLELCGAYWMIQAMASYGDKMTAGHLSLTSNVAGTIYDNGTTKTAMLWNPSSVAQNVTYIAANGTEVTVAAAARSFSNVTL
jgi:endo-1,3(4)-beta-glucanase